MVSLGGMWWKAKTESGMTTEKQRSDYGQR